MKINRNFLSWVALSVVSIVFFQNCGQQGDIALKLEDDSSDTLVQDICEVNPNHVRCTNQPPTGKVEEYRYIDVSQPVIPDLKIFLVLDNSDSMRVSQVNLVDNIEKMFSANGEGLMDYNSEIFIITTAQLNNIGNSLFRNSIDAKNDYQKVIEKIHEISNVQFVQNLIETFRPDAASGRQTSGLLEGDMVGFKVRTIRSPSNVAPQYDEFNLDFVPAYLTHVDQSSIFSVKYTKGGSIQDLVSKIKARVEFLNPEKQFLSKNINLNGSSVDNIPLSNIVEKESGLCAMARVLHEVKNNSEESLVKKGELATFILVSDEKEHDPQGIECVKSYKFQQPVPGDLYKGQCVDTESNVSYKIPKDKTVTLKVKRPFTTHVRHVYETIQAATPEVAGKCEVKFSQTQARLKILKNTHTATFDRKVVDANGDTVVDSWTHDLSYNRKTLKHKVKFDRTTLKHKVTFKRYSLKYGLTATRTYTKPKYSLDIKRSKIAKYQKVNFSRKTILKKEGGQRQVVDSYVPSAPLRISNVNIANASDCTVAWLRALPAVAASESALSANESYEYTISQCVVDNTSTQDNKVVEVFNNKPIETNCNQDLARAKHPEILAANEFMKYDSVVCSAVASVVAVKTVTIETAGVVPSAVQCNTTLAGSLDPEKITPIVANEETLVYSNVACSNKTGAPVAGEFKNLAGNYSAADLNAYIFSLDNSPGNTSYSDQGYENTPESELGVILGPFDGSAPGGQTALAYAAAKDGRSNTTYSNAEYVVADETTSTPIVKSNLAGKYTFTSNADLLVYIRGLDGGVGNANLVYTVVLQPVNKAKLKEVIKQSITIAGKTPGAACSLEYVKSKDSAVPTLAAGETLVYTNQSCSATNSKDALNISGVKFDGSYGNLVRPFESALGTTAAAGRSCDSSEQSAFLTTLRQTYSELVIDNQILEWDATAPCKLYNSVSTNAATVKTNIVNAINGSLAVKKAENAGVCDAAIATYCTNNSTNNPNNQYGCSNDSAKFISYKEYKPEYRKYTLKAPVKMAERDEIHWYGFTGIQVQNPTQTVNLLQKKCSEVPGACVGATEAQGAMLVQDYFKMLYANNDSTRWSAFVLVTNSSATLSDSRELPECNSSFMPDYPKCNNYSPAVSDVISYDTVVSDIAITTGIDNVVSCEDNCDQDRCKTKSSGSSVAEIPWAGKKVKEFYSNNCSVGAVTTAGELPRATSAVMLTVANSEKATYAKEAEVCNLTCAESGLCKIAANSELDISAMTVKQYIAAKNQIDVSKVTSCKIMRKDMDLIQAKRSYEEVDNACIKPDGTVLANKYVRGKESYFDANPAPLNNVKLVRENDSSLENYIVGNFAATLGQGYVSMIAFTSQKPGAGGELESVDYNQVAQSVRGQVHDVRAPSNVYGEALKFLGEKVASQLASSFKVMEIDPSQQITRVWYSSWFTKGKFIELSPSDYSTSANSFVITNPGIINKMKNEAAFKFFVEIY
ncbi:MAG: hypothetical protein JNL11_08640 [Bdellovibrionaceae bacterium]|nr:hypothetical protein [Pseudobdellovibrionaceae bacterium]